MAGIPVTPASAVAVVFAVTGAYFLVRVAFGFSWIDRVTSVTHVVMAVAMILMAWPDSPLTPGILQIAVFAAAALWYVYLLAARPAANAGPLLGHHGGSPALLGYHAFMMASMIWMALAMSPLVTAAPRTPAMPGMTAPSVAPGAQAAPAGAGSSLALTPGQASAISTTLGVAYVLAAIWLLLLFAVRTRGARGRYGLAARLDGACSVAMAGGMSVAFLLLMG